MEQHLKNALASLRLAQEEILHPCEIYSQLDDMQSALQDIIDIATVTGDGIGKTAR